MVVPETPALGVWAQLPQFTNYIQWIFSIPIDFGHSEGFLKNCSPWSVTTLGTAAIFCKKGPIFSGEQGEHFVKISLLCPIPLYSP